MAMDNRVLENITVNFVATLAGRKEELALKWAELILGTYPPETQAVWKGKRNKFSNPIGTNISESTTALFALLVQWEDAETIARELDFIVRIRAVQNFKPSKALSFIYLIKKVLRDEFLQELKKEDRLEELVLFETRVDNLALIAFDQFAEAREVVYNSRVKEVKNAQYNLLRRANMIVDSTATGADEL